MGFFSKSKKKETSEKEEQVVQTSLQEIEKKEKEVLPDDRIIEFDDLQTINLGGLSPKNFPKNDPRHFLKENTRYQIKLKPKDFDEDNPVYHDFMYSLEDVKEKAPWLYQIENELGKEFYFAICQEVLVFLEKKNPVWRIVHEVVVCDQFDRDPGMFGDRGYQMRQLYDNLYETVNFLNEKSDISFVLKKEREDGFLEVNFCTPTFISNYRGIKTDFQKTERIFDPFSDDDKERASKHLQKLKDSILEEVVERNTATEKEEKRAPEIAKRKDSLQEVFEEIDDELSLKEKFLEKDKEKKEELLQKEKERVKKISEELAENEEQRRWIKEEKQRRQKSWNKVTKGLSASAPSSNQVNKSVVETKEEDLAKS